MREIKFRAWVVSGYDLDEKPEWEMVDGDSLAFEEYAPICDLLRDKKGQAYYMQFTGLKDKNGKEIYEGDIVRIFWTSENGDYTDCEILFDEKYLSYNFCEIGCEKPGNPLAELVSTRYELDIISNVYEHPHLLNSEQTAEVCDARDDDSKENDDNQK